MKWSQLKKRVESNFAASVKGRVQVWNTRYRGSHDVEGEAWITVDGERAWSMGSLSYMVAHGREAERIRIDHKCSDFGAPDQREGYMDAWHEAQGKVHGDGVFAMWDVNRALFDYLNLSIDAAIRVDNPITRAFAILDRRFGKRRLAGFDDSGEHPLVKMLYRVRCEAEGISKDPEQAPCCRPPTVVD